MRVDFIYKGREFGISEKEHPWKPTKLQVMGKEGKRKSFNFWFLLGSSLKGINIFFIDDGTVHTGGA